MAQELPPKPRKMPQQVRSQRMVNAIIEGCKKILVEYGEEALTLPLLEAVSGVGKGSIYQYFPNLDAVVAELYRCECKNLLASSSLKIFQDASTSLSFESLLRQLNKNSIDAHRQLQTLHSSFYRAYSVHYDIHELYVEEVSIPTFAKEIAGPILMREYPGLSPNMASEIASLALQAVKSQFFTALEFFPERIYQEEFQQYLIDIALFVVNHRVLIP